MSISDFDLYYSVCYYRLFQRSLSSFRVPNLSVSSLISCNPLPHCDQLCVHLAAKGMLYLHDLSPPVIHRDLKTQNLLVDEYWRAKLCDFGLSREKASETMSRLGTIQYSAPEVLRGERYTEKADVYSYAILIWEMFTEEIPYEGFAPLNSIPL
eukprot:TRINITY_DN955_c0_g1_i3.p1 TRINITY_DN955_c0_g1~~TRINITY_DN955_c0_g1_i3.p1  ORF type:complete len:176 (+),score=23.58 TRINITY_DN955_c0_g1_i3:69-530(+)